MKINNKGFMLLETLIVAVFLVATLIFLYVQFNRVRSSYNISFTYNTSTNVYSSNTFLDYLKENGLSLMYQELKENKEQVYDLSSCEHPYLENTEMCKSLVSNLGIKEIYLVSSDLIWIKQNIPASASNEMVRFINTLKEQDGVGSRLIVEFSDGTFASILARIDNFEIEKNEMIATTTFRSMTASISNNIEHITFENVQNISAYNNATIKYDLSADKVGEVIAYLDGSTFRIQANGKINATDLTGYYSYSANEVKSAFGILPNLKSLDMTHLDTSDVTSMYFAFASLPLTSLDVSMLNTSNVTDMTDMFHMMINIEYIDVSNFDTSKVTNMTSMFNNMHKLKELDISMFDITKVNNTQAMFADSIALQSINLNFDNVLVTTNTPHLFYNNQSITELDLTKFDFTNATNTASMFDKVPNLETVYVKSQADADVLNNSANIDTNVNIVVK